MTTVLSIRNRSVPDLLSRPDFLYVGPRHGLRLDSKLPASPWSNPYSDSHATETEGARELFAFDLRLLLRDPGSRAAHYRMVPIAAGLRELRGKVLGCVCGDWRPGERPILRCHGVTLAVMVNEMFPEDQG